jgi:predicted transcriptional regulator
MISRSVLFYWSKGAETRRRILSVTRELNISNEPCFINILAEKLNLSHVAIKKHVELLVDENYMTQMNPNGKPIYLELTDAGCEVVDEMAIE